MDEVAAAGPPTAPSEAGRPVPVSKALVGSVLAQAVSSGTNFLVLVGAARELSAEQFGAFSLALGIVLLAMSAARALSVESLLVLRSSASCGPERADRRSVGANLLLGLLTSALLGSVAALSAGPSRVAFATAAVLTPAIFVQDALRYVLFSQKRPLAAAGLDAIWAAMVLGALAMGLDLALRSWMILWGGGAAASALVGVVVLRLRPDARKAPTWIRETAHLGLPYFGEFVVAIGASQAVIVLLAGISGLEAVGAVRAGMTIFGPLNVLFAGSYLIIVPHVRGLFEDAPGRVQRFLVAFTAGFVLVATLWSLAIIALPDDAGRWLFGASWRGADELVVALGVSAVFSATATGAVLSMRGAGEAAKALRARIYTVPTTVILPAIGAWVDDARGFAMGMAGAGAVMSLVWWHTARRTVLAPGFKLATHSGGARSSLGQ